VAHVRDVYPNVAWVITKASGDGGKDAIGTVVNLSSSVTEIYWMEAKNREYVDHYALGPHLFTVVVAKNVQCLHVVASGTFSSKFLIRAQAFAEDHSLKFSYSDGAALAAWLARHPERLHVFGAAEPQIAHALATDTAGVDLDGLFASAFIVPENDAFRADIEPVNDLLPGLKYALIVAFSRAIHIPRDAFPLSIEWHAPQRIYLLDQRAREGKPIEVMDIGDQSLVVVPFRVTAYEAGILPAPRFRRADLAAVIDIPLRPTRVAEVITSPFVGERARTLATAAKRRLMYPRDTGRATLFCYFGKAGSGKSRLAQEIRDDAQASGFDVRMLRFTPNASEQVTLWRRLFRWWFGLENNLFAFKDTDLLDRRLARVDSVRADDGEFAAALQRFLIDGQMLDELFEPTQKIGTRMIDALDRAIRLASGPHLIHFDDAHHLTERTILPLRLLKHLMATSPTLHLAVLVSFRDDETVVQPAVRNFLDALRLEESEYVVVEAVPEFEARDAQALVRGVLRVPEIRASESQLVTMILERAGLNAFSLMQLLHHLVVEPPVDDETKARPTVLKVGRDTDQYLVAVEALKARLREIPSGIASILKKRFVRLKALRPDLFEMLVAAAIVGRHTPWAFIVPASGHAIQPNDAIELFRLGYIADATDERFLLAHDLLVEHLLKQRKDMQRVAVRAIGAFGSAIDQAALGDTRVASIYYHAGARHWPESWMYAERAVRAADALEDHRSVRAPFRILEGIHHRDRSRFPLDPDLRFVGAIADQHCGNTAEALHAFVDLREEATVGIRDPLARCRYVDASIEAGNQSYHLLELTAGIQYINDAIAELEHGRDTQTLDDPEAHLSLALNRKAAIFQLAGRVDDARLSFDAALTHAMSANDAYMVCHTLWNLAALARARDPAATANFLRQARDLFDRELASKRRLNMLLLISAMFSACLVENTAPRRRELHALASDALQMNFSSLAADALLCRAACALAVRQWSEATDSLLRVLDIGTVSENQRARLFAYHYLAVCESARGAVSRAFDANDQVRTLAHDQLFAGSHLLQCVAENEERIPAGKVACAITIDIA